MWNRVLRPTATILCISLMSAIVAQAGPVRLNNVVNVVSGSSRTGWQNTSSELRLASQDGSATSSATTPQDGSATQDGAGGIQVQTEEVTEVTSEECECGDIPIAGGITKWPFLAFVPAICLTGICTKDDQPPCTTPPCAVMETPTPTPPTTTVPEPATLLLFGTGLAALGAGARRRYSRSKAIKQMNDVEGL